MKNHEQRVDFQQVLRAAGSDWLRLDRLLGTFFRMVVIGHVDRVSDRGMMGSDINVHYLGPYLPKSKPSFGVCAE